MSVPIEPKGHTPKEIFQKVKSDNQWEVDLLLDPEKIPWIYIGNVIQRTLSRMIGQGPFGPVTVKCTKDGSLAMVARGGAFDDYERLEHVYTAAKEVKEFTFTQQVERIDIFTYSDRIDYQLTRDLAKTYGDKIELFEDSFYSLDFYTKKVYCTCVSFSPKVDSVATSQVNDHLMDTTKDFLTDSLCSVGDFVYNETDDTSSVITAIADQDLTLADNIFDTGNEAYLLDPPRTKLMGWFQATD